MHGLSRDQASYVLLGMVLMLNLGTLGYGPLDRWFGTRRGVVLAGAGASLADPRRARRCCRSRRSGWWSCCSSALGLATPFYVTLTAHGRSFVPLERAGRLVTTINLAALSTRASSRSGCRGLLVGLTGGGAALGSALGYRLVFGFLALHAARGAAGLSRRPGAPERAPARRVRGRRTAGAARARQRSMSP